MKKNISFLYYFFIASFLLGSRELLKKCISIPWYIKDKRLYRKQQKTQSEDIFPVKKYYPCLLDKHEENGSVKGHYYWQDSFVARKIFAGNPVRHVDVGSRVDGFVTQVSIFREIEVIDIRPSTSNIKNVSFIQADLMSDNFELENYTDSISSLHAIEHFGLGRYGDSIDVYGHLKGLNNIYKALSAGGKFYFSVPIGEQRTEFNAHRVFSLSYLLNLFDGKYAITSFSYVDDKGDLHENVSLSKENIESNLLCRYGCGIFELTRY
jgi:SAM-dependent methyltransferase